ncbi:hypothetical protein COV24_00055 [candidate division WWE3 bacterium CG10_big_fil_rev_8_21_14_0_10_32_10]|uniref:Gram-positive cocci surface proteins LPxTG domain-containing protein n=1 Tax=candidate division WWE3 bacterium CG10_big_fil_rev_8_21_14_0_10_32_10 TaxID=1975090 RepID=A0A2H0RBN2_UNCKA|nr:MAG: hypothetical protein COV24_00055 [candidate division WWE3 bacterium CG10_big_fil_rev_8_21_14_0_10_32_10]
MSGESTNNNLIPNSNITFGGSGSSRTVSLVPKNDQNGHATITIYVSDGTLSSSKSFSYDVRSGDADIVDNTNTNDDSSTPTPTPTPTATIGAVGGGGTPLTSGSGTVPETGYTNYSVLAFFALTFILGSVFIRRKLYK